MLLGGLDIGTTGCKLTLYKSEGDFVGNAYREYNVTRRDGYHEIDPEIIWSSVTEVIRECAEKYGAPDAIGVTSFGESFAALDEDGKVLFPAMIYTDVRGDEETEAICRGCGEAALTRAVGVKPNKMFSLPKLLWIKNHRPDVYARIKRVLLMQDFIVYRLSGKAQIEYAVAARTMALDIREKCWYAPAFRAAGIDPALFSAPVPAGTVAGNILPEQAKALGLKAQTLIVTGAQDQIAAALGAGVLVPGQAVDGTGTVECITPVFDHVPESEKLYEEGYSVVPFATPGNYVCYALSFTGGAVLKWYRDQLSGRAADEAAKEGKNVYAYLDAHVPEAPTGLYVLPHFAGAANPYMDSGSRAAILGLTLETTAFDIYKALMEGVTYEIMTNVRHLEDFGITPEELTATGGGAGSPVWLQIKADILGRPVRAVKAKEAGAAGTCMMVAVAAGIYPDLAAAKEKFVIPDKTYLPDKDRAAIYRKYFENYQKIYGAVRPLFD